MSIQRSKSDKSAWTSRDPDTIDTLPLLASDHDSDTTKSPSTKQSAAGAALTIVKACVGAGSFGLPYAFTQSGFWGGVVGIILLGILSTYTMHMLSWVVRRVGLQDKKELSYVDIAQASLGRWASVLIYIGICLCSLGICGAYLIFCAQLLNQMVPAVPNWAWMLIMAAPLTPLTWLRSYKYLAFTSILGDIAVVIGVVTVLGYGFSHYTMGNPLDTSKFPPVVWSTYPNFFGNVAFLFCVHMVIPPIEQSMVEPRRFPRALNISMLLVTVLNLALPVICYLLWGTTVSEIVVSDVPDSAWYGILARVALIVDLFFTFLVVIVPTRDILESSILSFKFFNPPGSSEPKHIWRILIRTFAVGICVLFAELVGSFQSMMGVVSGLALSFMAFILPPTMRFILSRGDSQYRWYLIIIDGFLFLFGLVAMVTTTYMAFIGMLSGTFHVDTTCWNPATWSQCHHYSFKVVNFGENLIKR